MRAGLLALSVSLLIGWAAGVELTICGLGGAPFLVGDGASVTGGYMYDVWATIAPSINDELNITSTQWVVFGDLDTVINTVATQPNAIGLGTIAVRQEIEDRVDLSQRFFTSYYGIAALRPIIAPDYLLCFEPFDRWVWISMMGLTFASGVVIWFLERGYQPQAFPKKIFAGVNEGVWFCWGVLSTSCGAPLVGFPARMYLVGWSTVAIIVVAAYTANLSAILQAQTNVKGIQTVADLGGQSVATVSGTSAETYLRRTVRNAVPSYYDTLDGAMRDLLDPNNKLAAVLYDRPILQSIVKDPPFNDTMFVTDDLLNPVQYAIATPAKSAYRAAINRALLVHREELVDLETKYFNFTGAPAPPPQGFSLEVPFMVGLCLVLAVGLVAGLCSHCIIRYGRYLSA